MSGKTAVYNTRQVTEYMLCPACEDRLHHPETVVAELALQPDDTFPGLDLVGPIVRLDNTGHRVASSSPLPRDLGTFALSVLWRASVSTTRSEVSLGSHYDEALRQYLLSGGRTPSGVILGIHLLEPRPGLRLFDRILFLPEGTRRHGYHVYHFAVPGLYFWFYVGKQPPPGSDRYCFLRHGTVIIGADEQLVPGISKRFGMATPRGGLATYLNRKRGTVQLDRPRGGVRAKQR